MKLLPCCILFLLSCSPLWSSQTFQNVVTAHTSSLRTCSSFSVAKTLRKATSHMRHHKNTYLTSVATAGCCMYFLYQPLWRWAASLSIKVRTKLNERLRAALLIGKAPAIKNLLLCGAAVNTQNDHGDTALICAARWGDSDLVQLVLDNKADINLHGQGNTTALIEAATNNHGAICGLLLTIENLKLNAQNESGSTALVCATQKGHQSIVRELINKDADVNCCDKIGCSAIMYAATHDHLEIIEILLATKKVDQNQAQKALVCAKQAAAQKAIHNYLETDHSNKASASQSSA